MLMISFFSRKPGLHVFEELPMLKSVKADFYADGVTAMDTSSGLILGRPFGGIAILWRKSIVDCIQIHKYNDSRVMAIEYNNGNRKLLAFNIYMPCDDRSTHNANYDEFINRIRNVTVLFEMSPSQTWDFLTTMP